MKLFREPFISNNNGDKSISSYISETLPFPRVARNIVAKHDFQHPSQPILLINGRANPNLYGSEIYEQLRAYRKMYNMLVRTNFKTI